MSDEPAGYMICRAAKPGSGLARYFCITCAKTVELSEHGVHRLVKVFLETGSNLAILCSECAEKVTAARAEAKLSTTIEVLSEEPKP